MRREAASITESELQTMQSAMEVLIHKRGIQRGTRAESDLGLAIYKSYSEGAITVEDLVERLAPQATQDPRTEKDK